MSLFVLNHSCRGMHASVSACRGSSELNPLHWRRSPSVQVKPVIIEITAREDSNADALLNLIVDTRRWSNSSDLKNAASTVTFPLPIFAGYRTRSNLLMVCRSDYD